MGMSNDQRAWWHRLQRPARDGLLNGELPSHLTDIFSQRKNVSHRSHTSIS